MACACFVGTVFLVPETLYDREASSQVTEELPLTFSKDADTQTQVQQIYAPYSFMRSIGFRRPPGGVLHNFMKPWRSLALPGTWVVTLQYGGLLGGVVTISTIGPQLVAKPPYLWGNNAGLINVGGLVGIVLGAVYTYLVSDARLRAAVKQHHFVEPEARLPTMFPALFIATAGFFVFGFCAQNPGPNRWVGLEFGYGMITFGLMQAPSIGFSYVSSRHLFMRMVLVY